MMLKKITAAAIHLTPTLLWLILGIKTNMPWQYYVLCGVLSVSDVIHTIVHATEAIRYIEHHTEDVR